MITDQINRFVVLFELRDILVEVFNNNSFVRCNGANGLYDNLPVDIKDLLAFCLLYTSDAADE